MVTRELEQRGIIGHLEHVSREVTPQEVHFESGASLSYDVLIAFPPYIAAMTYDSLPHDERGFLATELETRQVVGHPDIYAPGDGGDFPVKQAFLAFLAFLQANAVANHIGSRVEGKSFATPFDPSGLQSRVSPMWRLGKKLLGVYLPMRLGAGEPFHAGTVWQLMDVGPKGMSGVLAD